MLTTCHEVQKFISACENIQSLLAQGGSLKSDERDLIELSAIDLLSNDSLWRPIATEVSSK